MAFNGSGTFLRLYSWIADAAAAIKISSTRMDAEMDGMATGLSNCITKDGQTTVTSNIPMGTFRHTAVGDAASLDNYPSTKQIQNGTITYDATDTGVANAYVAGLAPAPTAYVDGMDVYLKIVNTNTGASTINVNALGVKSIKTLAGADPVAGAIIAGQIAHFKYNGTNFLLLTESNLVHNTGNETIAGNKTFTGTLTMTSKAINEAQGADLASAATTNIWTQADGNTIHITGVASITSFGTAPQIGASRHIIADGAFTIVPGANITGLAGNVLCDVGDTFDVYANNSTTSMAILNFNRGNGTALNAPAANITGSITATQLGAATVRQSSLISTAGSVSTAGAANLVLPGGYYGFYPRIFADNAGTSGDVSIVAANLVVGLPAVTRIYLNNIAALGNLIADQRYIQASPPYNLGDGDIPLFIFAEVDNTGKVISSYSAPEAPWHYNGPTSIKAESYRLGIPYYTRSEFFLEFKSIRDAVSKGLTAHQASDRLNNSKLIESEITQEVKNADINLLPHPFLSKSPGNTIIMIDPVSTMCETLCNIQNTGEQVIQLLQDGYLILGDEVKRSAPPGVKPISIKWKLT